MTCAINLRSTSKGRWCHSIYISRRRRRRRGSHHQGCRRRECRRRGHHYWSRHQSPVYTNNIS